MLFATKLRIKKHQRKDARGLPPSDGEENAMGWLVLEVGDYVELTKLTS